MSTWTFQSKLSANSRTEDMVSDHGTTIAAFFNTSTSELDIWRSTNGGVSWTAVATNLAFSPSGGALVYAGSNIWFFLGYGANASAKSTNDGQTWTTFVDANSSVGYGAATDGAGTIVSTENAAKVTASVNGNSPFTEFSTPTSNWAGVLPGGLIYDGTQFVALSQKTTPSTTQAIWTAPTGFTIGAGPVWTQQGSTLSSAYFIQHPFGQGALISHTSAIGYACKVADATYPRYALASSPGGLTTVTPTNFTNEGVQGAGVGISYLKSAAGALFISSIAKNVWRSYDGSTWSQDTLSQAFTGSESAAYFALDSVNGNLIMMGDFSSVYTAALPISISPTNPSVVAGGQQQFTATTVPSGAAVSWSCLYGTISSSGLYTAPSGGHLSDTVSVALQSNPGINVSTNVTITGNTVTLSPHSVSVPYGSSTLFTVTTTPAGAAVVWSVGGIVGGDGVHGTIADGYYVAPALPNGIGSVTVKAAWQGQPSIFDTATVTLTTPTIGGGSNGGQSGGTSYITGKFRGPKVFKPVMLAKAATIPLRVYEPNENKTFKG